MKTNEDYFNHVKNLISEGKVDTAISKLNQLFQHTSEWNEIIQQSFRWKDLAAQIRKGTLSYEDASLTKNQIVHGLLSLMKELETSYTHASNAHIQEEIQKAISIQIENSENVVVNSDLDAGRDIHIGSKETTNIGEQHIYYGHQKEETTAKTRGAYFQLSCDRRDIKLKFDRVCDELRENQEKCHLFFIEGKIKGQAASLAQRLKADMMAGGYKVGPAFNLEEFKKPVVTVSVDGSLNQEDLRYGMRKDFNRIYGIRPEVSSMEELVSTIDKVKDFQSHDYLIFDIDISFHPSLWEKEVKILLDWLINDFAKLKHSMEQHFFFFVILNNSDSEVGESKGIFSKLFGKKQGKTTFDLHESMKIYLTDKDTTLLPPLQKVSKTDLAHWFKRFAGTQGDAVIEAKNLATKLPGNEPWDMHDVETELRKIVDDYRNKQKGI